MIVCTAGKSAGATRAFNGMAVSRSALAAPNSRSRCGRSAGRRPTRCSRRAPVSRSLASSSGVWPAASFFVTALRHVAHGSLHASTRKVHRPGSPAVTTPANWSRPSPTESMRTWWAGPRLPTLRQTMLAATASWPSRHTSAAIGMTSPTTALAGWRPSPTVGVTSSIPSRPVIGTPPSRSRPVNRQRTYPIRAGAERVTCGSVAQACRSTPGESSPDAPELDRFRHRFIYAASP